MKFSAIALSVVLASAAVAAHGDPGLIQGALEWPPALTGAEPFIVVRGDDGRVYYADVMAAQRYVQGALSAGGHVALLGLESTKPHEIIAVALGSGDAAALSFAFAQATPTASLTSPPSPSPGHGPRRVADGHQRSDTRQTRALSLASGSSRRSSRSTSRPAADVGHRRADAG